MLPVPQFLRRKIDLPLPAVAPLSLELGTPLPVREIADHPHPGGVRSPFSEYPSFRRLVQAEMMMPPRDRRDALIPRRQALFPTVYPIPHVPEKTLMGLEPGIKLDQLNGRLLIIRIQHRHRSSILLGPVRVWIVARGIPD